MASSSKQEFVPLFHAKSAAYIGGTETLGKFGVGTVELLSSTGSLNLRTSLINRPCKNFIVSGPRNRTTDRDLSFKAKGPVASRLWVEKDWFDEK
uniref:Uncharacterized protein n=1 Tax=Fagus sylvatica TaxID=28930 RepID=A0A2N9FLU2_FAGSY